MRQNNTDAKIILASTRGFTLTEILVVIAIMAILATMAIPSFVSWRQNLEYRQTARSIGTALRDARTYSISDNRQYGVQIDSGLRRFRFTRGNAVTNSTVWQNITRPGPQAQVSDVAWTTLSPRVTIFANTPEVRFSPNGTATFSVLPLAIAGTTTIISGTGGIIIRDDAVPPADRFGIVVTPTGRIQVRQPPF